MYGRTLEMESSSPNKTSLFFPAQVSEVFQAVFEENEKVASRGQTKPPFFFGRRRPGVMSTGVRFRDKEECREKFPASNVLNV